MQVHEALKAAQVSLVESMSANEAKQEAQLFMQHTLNVNRAWLITNAHTALSDDQLDQFNTWVNRRRLGEPVAYILGYREFYGLNFAVSPATLIPRADTETLVEAALNKIPTHQSARILDLGTGSGAVALAIAYHRPQSEIHATDVSPAALEVASANATALRIKNVHFMQSNWFSAIPQSQFDVITSNPPYISQNDDHLNQGDLRFEPRNALVAEDDGLADIRTLISDSLIYLKPQGWLMLEHGYNQGLAVRECMAETGYTDITTLQDLAGNDRVTLGKNPLILNTHWQT